MDRFPELILQGAPYEMGCQQVEQLGRDAVVDRVREGFKIYADYSDKPDFYKYLNLADESLRVWAPHLAEEIEGIAAASGLPYEEVLAHNYYTTFRRLYATPPEDEQCSCVGMADTDEGPAFGKNNDASPGPEGCYIARRHPQGKYRFVDFTYYGLVSVVAGINETGFCFGGASLGAIKPQPISATDIPVMMILRRWLEDFSTVDEAIQSATTESVDCGAHYLIADDQTQPGLVHIEWIKSDIIGVNWPDEAGNVYCANIVCTDECIEQLDPDGGEVVGNSRDRLDSIRKLLQTTPRTVDGIKSIMSSHNLPGVICQHDKMGSSIMETALSSVFVPRERTVWISHGIPCQNPYEAYVV